MKLSVVWMTLLVGVLAIFVSCEFELESENFVEIEPPNPESQIEISLSPFENQYVFTVPTMVQYNLKTFGLNVYNVEFFVGEQSIHTASNASGYFDFDPAPWGIGTETMTMLVTTNTNTGSLADKLGAEGLVFQHTWEVLLDGGNPNPVEINTIYNNKGVLKIEWDEYTRFNFQKYLVYKNFGAAEASYEKHIIAEITDPTNTTFSDSSFIGGSGNYWIEVQASNQSATSQTKVFNYEPPQVELVWLSNDSAKFQWQKNAFYNSIKKIELRRKDVYAEPDKILFSTVNSNDVSCTIRNIPFGNSIEYTLQVYPKSEIKIYANNQNQRSAVSFGIGTAIPEHTKTLVDEKNGVAYFSNNENILKYDIETGKELGIANSGFVPQWFISNFDNSLYTLWNAKVTRFSATDLNNSETFETYDIGLHSISNKVDQHNRIAGSIGLYLALYDFTKKEIVYQNEDPNLGILSFSDDGSYAFSTEYRNNNTEVKVYEYTGTEINLVSTFHINPNAQANWFPNSNKLYYINGYYDNEEDTNPFVIYNCETKAISTEFEITSGSICGIDTRLNLLGICTEYPQSDNKKEVLLYNLSSGKVQKSIPLLPRLDDVVFADSYVFSGQGFYSHINSFSQKQDF